MKKRLIKGLTFTLWFAVLMLLPLLSVMPARAESYTLEEYFTFVEASGTITGYNTAGGNDVSIPPTIRGVPVTAIGANAFELRDTITSVVIPTGVTSIGSYAFARNYDHLGSITIPDSVTSIGEYAFSECYSLSSITIPIGLTSIGEGAFGGCYSLRNITIPAGVTSIGNYAFGDCTYLGSITLPAGVTSIGNGAFQGCSSLSSLTIPAGVTSIADSLFYNCGNLSSIAIPNSVTRIENSAFVGCNSLGSITIPNSVTSIGNGAFASCMSLGSITLPSGVTSIGSGVFSGCSSLGSITLPAGVTSIGNNAFEGCSNLNSITIPSGVTSIGESAFAYCSSLGSITIPSGVTSIGGGTFASCSSLGSIIMPPGVTSIGDGTFASCSSLSSITIPSGVTSIGHYTFYNCTSLTGMYFQGDAPSSMGSNVFDGIAGEFKIYYPYGVLGWTNPWNGYPTTVRCTVSYDSQGGSAVASVIVNAGDLISQPVTPTRTGYTLDGWYSEQGLTNAFNFVTPITGNITLYAKWNAIPNRKAGVPATATASVTVNTAYTLNLTTIFEDADTDHLTYKVSVNGAADTGANANYSHTPVLIGNTTLVFKANDGTTDSTDTCTVTLTANPVTHSVAISANPAAGGSITGGGTYSEGGSVTVTATPNSGYTFVNWTEGSNPVSSNAAYIFTLGTSDRNLVANFAVIPTYYTVGIGTLSGGDIIADQTSAPSGTTINLTLTPNTGRQLKAGTLKYNDDTNNYTISGTSFTMPAANVTVTAEFEAAPQVILDTGGEDGQALLPPGTTDLQLGANSVLDLANGLQTASGGNITVGGQSQSMNSFTGGNLSNVDLTVPQNVGGLAVQLEKAVRLESGTNNQPITITNSGLAGVSASIPDGTTILAPAAWNGNLNPPRQVASTGTAPSGFSVGNTVIEVGAPNAILLFDKPVTLTLQGVIGTVGYKPAGSNNWVQITQQAGGTYANPTPPPFPGEAYISNGTDTKIITYHMTAFAGLVSAPPPYEPPAWYSVSGVSLDKTTLSFNVGDASSTLKVSIQPNYASYPAVTWSSSEPSVARVNGGVVTPVGVGKSIIMATTIDGQKTALCTVIVTPSPGENDQWDERKAEQSVAGDKTWRIKFSKAISPESINRQNIMVLDSKNEPVEIEVKADVVSDSIILVTPKVPYTKGERYRLFLGVGLKSLAGKSLTKGIMYSFTVK